MRSPVRTGSERGRAARRRAARCTKKSKGVSWLHSLAIDELRSLIVRSALTREPDAILANRTKEPSMGLRRTIAVLVWLAMTGIASAQEVHTPEHAIPNQYIVVLKDEQVARAQVQTAVDALARSYGG